MCPDLDPDAVRQAAEYVAGNCRKAGLTFTFVVHGGGEPLMDLRLPGIMADVNKIAARQGLQISLSGHQRRNDRITGCLGSDSF